MWFAEMGCMDAPGIVFLHGVGASGWMWQLQVRDLSNHFHCLVPDLPGHGRSKRQPWKSMDETASGLAGLIARHFPHGRAHVVGLSLGAYAALHLAQNFPECVDHLVISGMNVLPFPNPFLFRLKTVLLAPLHGMDFILRANAARLHIPAEAYAEYRDSARAMSSRTLVRIFGEVLDFRISEELTRVQAPVLVAAGGREHPLIRESIPLLLDALAHSRGCIAPGVGHGWNGEAPDLFSSMVHCWVTDQPLPSGLECV